MPVEDTHKSSRTKPSGFIEAVLKPSQSLPDGVHMHVKGYNFNNGVNFDDLMQSYLSTGFQATHFGRAVNAVNLMINQKDIFPPEHESKSQSDLIELNLHQSRRTGCTIFLAYTSNMITSGIREVIRYLVEHKMVDVLVTSAGGIEEDFVKCMAPFYVGDFARWSGASLRDKGINRTGNLLIPNDNYVLLENWLCPIFDKLLKEQNTQNVNWTPSKIIDLLGKEIDNQESVYYWCHKNQIPVFCPGFTDGSVGDILYAHSYQNPGLRVDVVEDVRRINSLAVYSYSTGIITLGGGIIKHHTLNANLMRNGADYCVYVNTGEEFDGSDAGARPDEAVSWGKVKCASEPVKIHADASLIFPLLVAQTFAKQANRFKTT